jgi:hypothetical protein
MGELRVMSASMDSDPGSALFREDLVILKREVASLIERTKGGATNNVQNATNQVERHLRSLHQEAGARLAWRAAIDWTFRAYRDPPTVALLCAVTAHKSVSRRVGDERLGSTSFDSVAAV